MRFFLAVIVAAMLITMTVAFEKPKRKACEIVCAMDYDPICGGVPDSKEKPKSFGNECVMKNYNCENNAKLVKLSKGECPGGGGVRLQ